MTINELIDNLTQSQLFWGECGSQKKSSARTVRQATIRTHTQTGTADSGLPISLTCMSLVLGRLQYQDRIHTERNTPRLATQRPPPPVQIRTHSEVALLTTAPPSRPPKLQKKLVFKTFLPFFLWCVHHTHTHTHTPTLSCY